MATHSNILAWRIPWTVYSPWGRKQSDMTEWLSLHQLSVWSYYFFEINISSNWCAVLSRSFVPDSITQWTEARQAPLFTRILQARILEWVPMPSSRGSSQTRDSTLVSINAGRYFTIWTTKEAQEYWSG